MSKSKHKNKSPAPFTSSRTARNAIIWVVIILGIVVVATLVNRSKQSGQKDVEPPLASPPQSVSTNTPAMATEAAVPFQKLKGKWLRPDGGYVIDIKNIEASGRMDAAYLNPKPIHVAQAEATHEGSAMKLFIKLQDVNYPGSTYTLVYVPERDLLAGVYYQALQQQSFEVYFERMK